ncbi:endonuclease MutS2 [Enterococcus massiliensis]|uniref:endonuclease MutS2 n=1 Tax=Enterococcus massiliensis TaxID=1640685 RepID=UPI00065E2E93|nr:mannonate oxidoreductase [Enterococcus massiliensis]
MDTKVYKETEFTKIKEEVIKFAISDEAKSLLIDKQPSTVLTTVEKRLIETKEAMLLLASGQHVPFMGMKQIRQMTNKIEKGMILEANELVEYSDFLRSFRLIRQLFEKNQFQLPTLFKYSSMLTDFEKITENITGMIAGNRVKSESSRALRKIRGRIQKLEGDIEKAFNKFLKSGTTQAYLQERMVLVKNDRYTLPVKSEFQSKIKGQIIERSNKGTTVFIEPEAVRKLNDELLLAKAEEVAEVYQILAFLTGLIAEEMPQISACKEIVMELDLIFARGKFSRSINGAPVTVNDEDFLFLDQVKHPLLGTEAVPLSVTIGKDARGLIITGPNAGGKTIVLKTIALTSLMTMFGLFVENSGKSSIPIFSDLFIDIGDQQSLENALSTFSGHMQNVSHILAHTKKHALILLDEIGSGTEPKEGAALGIALMEAMYQKGAIVIATTHYGEIKDFALAHEDFITAAMAFDAATLTPKYQLMMNQVGDSNAFWIAEKMRIEPEVITKAKDYLSGKEYGTQKHRFTSSKKVSFAKKETPKFHKGDRVFTTDHGYGIFYDYQDQNALMYNGEMLELPLQRLKLITSYDKLYPENYDLDSLFTDYHEQKFIRDIERGSKKAHKKLRKLAEKRQQK